ncbi:MAG: beta-ketoacyl-ACP synthase III [bacterium]|nr:beta-ketoacyl-ACP synthase III [bacterium]
MGINNRERHAPNGSERMYAHIVGWGMAVPEHIMTNDDLAVFVDTSNEWIVSRTGIRERRIAGESETTATLGLAAARQALEVANVLPENIDMVVVATSTPDHIFPSTASLIQAGLGANRAGAFDLSAACSGFVYAVHMAAQAIQAGSIRTAVVIGAETMSRVMDWQDRATCILFGDGAGAVVLRASAQEGGVLSSVLRSDGTGGDLLGIPSVGTIDYVGDDITLPEVNGHRFNKMHMNGGEVFKFATRVIAESVTQALEQSRLTIHDVRLIVPHQANLRIIAAAARALKVDESLFMCNLDRYGNTSAASIPIALVEAVEQGLVKQGDPVVFVGFGGGLTWASMVVRWGAPVQESSPLFNRQRRALTYSFARLRARITRVSRQLNETARRVRPEQGRIDRLRHKINRRRL